MLRELPLPLLALLCLVGDFALVLTGHAVPPLLETVTTVTIGAVAGVSLPRAKAA